MTWCVQPLAQDKTLLYFHIATGAVPLLLGPFQLWPGSIRRALLAWHRRIGTVYLGCAFLTAVPTLYMSWLFMVSSLAKVSSGPIPNTSSVSFIVSLSLDFIQL